MHHYHLQQLLPELLKATVKNQRQKIPHVYLSTGIGEYIDDDGIEDASRTYTPSTLFILLLVLVLCANIVNAKVVDIGTYLQKTLTPTNMR